MALEKLQVAASIGVTNSGSIDKIYQYNASVTSFTEKKYNFPDFEVNSSDNIYVGDSTKFYSLYTDLTTHVGSQTALSMSMYYWNGTSWAVVTPESGSGYTNWFTQSGQLSWRTSSITDSWQLESLNTAASVSSVDSVDRYWMKISFNPVTQNLPLEIHEFRIEEPPTYTPTGLSPWTFTLNPEEITPHPIREQSVRRTMSGSVNVQAATGDGSVRSMSWSGLDESRWGEFIHGISGAEQGKLDRVYFYNESIPMIDGSGTEAREITDQTFHSYTITDESIPFKETEINLGTTEWVVSSSYKDRLFLGLSSTFDGIRLEFDKPSNQYITDYVSNDDISYINSIQVRFSDSTGDLGGTVASYTIDKDNNYTNDGTEMFTHDGQILWVGHDTSGWSAVSLNNVIDNTSDLSDPSPKLWDEESLYWIELQISYLDTLAVQSTKHLQQSLNIKISEIRTSIDSLYYLSTVRSDGTLPYWYLRMPSSLSNYRPRGRKEEEWIPIKVLDVIRTPSRDKASVKKRWDVEMKYVIATDFEAPVPFRLDSKPLDSAAFLYLKQ